MQREIKFRGKWQYVKDSNGETFCHSESIGLAEFLSYLEEGILDRSTLGQYTGLTDCQGREIYEGDIIEYVGKTDYMHIGRVRSVVEWIRRSCGFSPMGWWFAQSDDDVKVIGNIHESPELLERKAE